MDAENTVKILWGPEMEEHFIEKEYLPAGEDEYYLRNKQAKMPAGGWRHLRSDEIERLVKNNNSCENWDNFLVTDEFNPKQIKNNKFFGLVRIGEVRDAMLQYHDLRLRVGITNSVITSCDIGNNVAIHDVHYLSHYIIGDNCIIFNIQEMCCTNHAKFGNQMLRCLAGESSSSGLFPLKLSTI